MRSAVYCITALAIGMLLTSQPAAQATAATANRQASGHMRIGVFDSRLVALAYYNTPEFRTEMQQMMSALQAAKAANNQAKIADLEFQGPAIQNLMHYQVFSTASIPNVLEKLTAALPKVAAEAGVSIIVSKWEVGFKAGDVDYVDVTDALVKSFNPDARTQTMIQQAGLQMPIPLLEAVKTLRADR